MSSGTPSLQEEFGATIAALAGALAAGNEELFHQELDVLVERREHYLFGELRRLATGLETALIRFSVDSRLVDLAEKEIPDARHRLDHVIKMTDEAAHRTMDLVEQSGPLAERTARQAGELADVWHRFRTRTLEVNDFHDMLRRMDSFLDTTRNDMERVRGNLAEVLLAQGYQDLSGQIIRGVMKLVGELEAALGELVRLSSGHGSREQANERANEKAGEPASESDRRGGASSSSHGFGPQVPGIDRGPAVSDQQDVDALLSGLGM